MLVMRTWLQILANDVITKRTHTVARTLVRTLVRTLIRIFSRTLVRTLVRTLNRKPHMGTDERPLWSGYLPSPFNDETYHSHMLFDLVSLFIRIDLSEVTYDVLVGFRIVLQQGRQNFEIHK